MIGIDYISNCHRFQGSLLSQVSWGPKDGKNGKYKVIMCKNHTLSSHSEPGFILALTFTNCVTFSQFFYLLSICLSM